MTPHDQGEMARRMMTAMENSCRAGFLLLALAMVATAAAQAKTVSRGGDGKLPSNLVSYVRPSYPYIARLKEWDGVRSFRVQIDAETGNVTSVEVLKTTTHKLLDECAIKALLKWQFRPHTDVAAIVPITFTVGKNPVSEARRLAVYAKDPDPPVTNHQGRGTFRFLVDFETGQVTDVQIVRPTGRPSFDQAVVKAFRQWRFLLHKMRSIDTTVSFGP